MYSNPPKLENPTPHKVPKKGLYGERGFPVLGGFEYTNERFPLKMHRLKEPVFP